MNIKLLNVFYLLVLDKICQKNLNVKVSKYGTVFLTLTSHRWTSINLL